MTEEQKENSKLDELIWPAGLVEQLAATLAHNLPQRRAGREPLVVGIFGEWGSGKSSLLEDVARLLEQQAEARHAKGKPESGETGAAITIPIRFNPWRYEREEHLIVPLLKSARAQLEGWAGRWYPGKDSDEAAGWLRSKIGRLGELALAVASGLKIKGAFVEVELKKIIDAAKEETTNPLAKYESIYYDLLTQLQGITGESIGGRPLNLVFFIDDLDRCLPDKAVEMLESIKLFFDVTGCAFVLAVDDEVVERGIAHRYRDYLLPARNGNGAGDAQSGQLQLPISGHEYLEKIIHLPVRLPVLHEQDVISLLRSRFAAMFEPPKPELDEALDKAPARELRQGALFDPARRQALLQLLRDAVPPVPRKLIRAGELLQFSLEMAERGGWHDCDPLTLARVLLIQLFAPRLYRFGRRKYNQSFLARMAEWSQDGDHYWWLSDGLDRLAGRAYQDAEERWRAVQSAESEQRMGLQAEMQSAQRNRDLFLKPLAAHILEAAHSRADFDPRYLFPKHPPASVPNLLPYLALAAKAVTDGADGEIQPPEADAIESAEAKIFHQTLSHLGREGLAGRSGFSQTGRPEGQPTRGGDGGERSQVVAWISYRPEGVRPQNPERFMDQLFGDAPSLWQGALDSEEGFSRAALDQALFQAFLERVGGFSRNRDPEWLDIATALLSGRQLQVLEERLKLRRELVERLAAPAMPVSQRAAAGRALARLGDPRPGIGCEVVEGHVLPALAWTYLPGTEEIKASGQWPEFQGFRPGNGRKRDPEFREDDEAWPFDRDVTIQPIWLAAYPVTVAQFRPFVEAGEGGYLNSEVRLWTKQGLEWRKNSNQTEPYLWQDPKWNLPNHPVVGVSWHEAVAYCRWLTERLRAAGRIPDGMEVRLPSELEWEWAARGPELRRWPWGDTWNPEQCNHKGHGLERTMAAGAFPGNLGWAEAWKKSSGLAHPAQPPDPLPKTALDMAGNVWEWCATKRSRKYRLPETSEWSAEYLESGDLRVLRGGAFWNDQDGCRGAYRVGLDPWDGDRDGGVRCCVATSSRSSES